MIVLESADTTATIRGNEMAYLVRYNQGYMWTMHICV